MNADGKWWRAIFSWGRATPVARLWLDRRRSRHWSGAPPASEHRGQDTIRRLMPVGEGLDVDQHLLAHLPLMGRKIPKIIFSIPTMNKIMPSINTKDTNAA